MTLAAHPREPRVNRRGLALAGALTLLSLGLPWERVQGIPAVIIPGVVIPYSTGGDVGSGVTFLPGIFFPGFSGGEVAGTGHTMRVTGLVAALLLWRAIRHRSRRTAWLAIAIGALALPLGVNQGALTPGRVAYLAALLTAAASMGLLSIPHPRRTNNVRHTPAAPTPGQQ